MRKLLFKNSISGVIQSILNILIVLGVIPFLLDNLGATIYGVFALLTVIGNLNVLTNLGLSQSLIKFIAQQGKSQESDYDIIICYLLSFVILLPLTIICIIFNKFILLKILFIPEQLFLESKTLYFFLLASNFFLIIGQISKSVLDARQLIVITNSIQIFYNILYWGLIFIVVKLGYSLPQIGLMSFLSALIWFSITTFISLKKWGNLKLNAIKYNYKRVIKKQFTYGMKIYFAGLIGFLFEPLTKILISNFIGISDVGIYDIALRIKNQFWGIITKIYYPIYPFLASVTDTKKIKFLINDIEQKAFIFILPFIIAVIFSTHSFVQLWIGQNVDKLTISIVVILVSYTIGTIVIPNYQFLIAKGYADKTIILQTSNVLSNIFVIIMTYKYLGYYAAILGNMFGILTSLIISLYYQKKYLDCYIFNGFRQLRGALVLILTNLCFGYILFLEIHNDKLRLFLIPFLIFLSSYLIIRYLKVFNSNDINFYLGKNQKIKAIINFLFLRNN